MTAVWALWFGFLAAVTGIASGMQFAAGDTWSGIGLAAITGYFVAICAVALSD